MKMTSLGEVRATGTPHRGVGRMTGTNSALKAEHLPARLLRQLDGMRGTA